MPRLASTSKGTRIPGAKMKAGICRPDVTCSCWCPPLSVGPALAPYLAPAPSAARSSVPCRRRGQSCWAAVCLPVSCSPCPVLSSGVMFRMMGTLARSVVSDCEPNFHRKRRAQSVPPAGIVVPRLCRTHTAQRLTAQSRMRAESVQELGPERGQRVLSSVWDNHASPRRT